MRGRILVVDDEQNIRTVLRTLLSRLGYEVSVAVDGRDALDFVQRNEVDLVLTDLRMPKLSGLELLDELKQTHPEVPVIVLTAHGAVDSAVDAMKRGASDFLSKGCDNDEVAHAVSKGLATRLLAKESCGIEQRGAPAERFGLIGVSDEMSSVFQVIERVAKSPSTVLISGECGTGKELVARALHRESEVSDGPFIRLNCTAIPASLIEAELFGYERGAFSGAAMSKPGRFELAHKGTLFLDEIGEIPLGAQVKLLRAIQEREFERVGGVQTIRVNVRVIAASNQNLRQLVEHGRFRQDLFYRLNVVPIQLPALRARIDDLEPLIAHLLRKFAERLNQSVRRVSESALDKLRQYSWPGNIRELENVIERTLLFSDRSVLDASDFHLGTSVGESQASVINLDEVDDLKTQVRKITRRVEKQMIEQTLALTGGNVTQTAKKLGISRKGLQLKMKELSLRENSS